MPVITIDLWEGRTVEQKRKLVKGVTDVVSKTTGCPEDAVQIIIKDHPKENWSIGGTLASEK